jgi:hypothetical protein
MHVLVADIRISVSVTLMSTALFNKEMLKGKGKVTPKQVYVALRGPGG